MARHEQFLERVVHVDRPTRHYTLLRSPTGAYLGTADGSTLGMLARVDDAAVRHTCRPNTCAASGPMVGSVCPVS